MGFADEVKNAKETKAFTADERAAAPAEKQEIDPSADLNSENPAPAPVKAEAPVEAAKDASPAPAVEPAKKKIRIGTQEFDNAEDALAYAQELELSLLQQEAYKQGLEAATPKQTVPEKTIEDEIENELFENPKQALSKYKQHILESVKADIKAEAVREANIKKTWTEFYDKNADLTGAREIVDYVLQKNWKEIGNLPVDKGLATLASKTRELLASYKEGQLPSKELPSAPVKATTASGTPATTVAEKKIETVVDFLTQLQQNRKRGAQKVQQT